MKKLLQSASLDTDAATLLLRLLFGILFVRYGYNKLIAYDMYVANFPDLIGIGGKLSFHLVIFAELVCGLLVTIGLLTRFAVIPILITMIVAFFLAHAKDPFDAKAISFVFLGLSVVIFLLGSGKYSVDKLVLKK
ncbi:DoxX family protein [Pseudochryseolinea flava]|uniref:DoxX family protein n=1 Tax=Pseudochryseolinea flava TaxID=2059302 RepID=A0A364Y9A5_9BACT|nr:DoxX family protein [Pseudochryseolinea flava]RAW02949.1 DoxX family protein [Pseudochryseolinea flava]